MKPKSDELPVGVYCHLGVVISVIGRTCEIQFSHGSDYEDYCRLQSSRSLPTLGA
jgi:hypothetical protein